MPKPGRGKRGRTQKITPKPRSQWVKLQAKAGPDGRINFYFDKETGGVFSPQAIPESVSAYQSYERDEGRQKVIYQTPGLPQASSFSLRHDLSSRFDVIAGIDTNTCEISGRRLSVAFSFVSAPGLHHNHDALQLEPAPAFVFEGVREGLNPEVVAWYHFLTNTLPLVSANGRYAVALVVDSELGRHSEINARTAPYYRGFFLPERTQLIYASSDTGTDLPNKLIKQCDKASRSLADQIRRGEIILPDPLGAGWEDYAGSAYINMQNSPFQLPHNK